MIVCFFLYTIISMLKLAPLAEWAKCYFALTRS